MAWPPSHALPGPLERGGLTFVQNPSNCLESQASKVFEADIFGALEHSDPFFRGKDLRLLFPFIPAMRKAPEPSSPQS